MVDDPEARKSYFAGVFDRAAPTYDRVGTGIFAPIGADLVARAGLRPGEHVLDLGCGSGANLVPAATAVGSTGRALGVDLAPGMVAEANAALADRGLSHASATVGDVERLDLPPESLDAVLAGFVIFFLPDAVGTLRRCAALLRPAGRLALTTWCEPDEAEESSIKLLMAALSPFLPPPQPDAPPGPAQRYRTRDSVRDLLTEAGYHDIEMAEQAYEVTYDSPEQQWDSLWSHGMRGMLEQIPAERLDEARSAFLASAAELRDPDGRVRYSSGVRFTLARRT